MKTAYFVDGYHGGIKGHMPLGAWADVLRRLEEHPEWKLCLDIEPISWDVLRRTDPASYETIRRLLEHEPSRVEIVAASYAQPFGWVIGGESNIRHLIRGRAIVREHFPGAVVDTYATQEPCWSSCLPQILRSLGYKRAVLKNPGTAWGGYASGIDRETVLWVGPDGTAIPCVPRYACEELVNCWETEAGLMEPDFVEKCLERGIGHPVGSFLQDLGWPAAPRLNREGIRYVTWREYMEEIAEAPTEEWHFTQEDIRCTLPWGEGTLQRMAREVRAAEIKILAAEKLASIAGALRGYAYPAEKLQAAWDQLMLSQHHDAWIFATTREGREQWAWQAGAQSWMAELLCDEVLDEAMDAFRQEGDGETASRIRVFNLSGVERTELTEIEIPLPGDVSAEVPADASGVRIRDAEGAEIPCQLVPTRMNRQDGRIQAGRLLFEAAPPAMGYQTYAIECVSSGDVRTGPGPDDRRAFAFTEGDHVVVVTDLYDIRLDTARGGVITSWYDKALNRAIVSADQPFNEYAGFLAEHDRWASSTETPADVTIKENGPLRVVVEIKGKFADADFATTLSAARGRRRVDFHVRFHYGRETWIGHPWRMAPEHRSTERRKSHHYTRYKLQARFPMKPDGRRLYKNSAFDVTLSRHEDTHYERWDEIKHNIILNWIDVYDERGNYGLAVFSDHTTDYSHGPDGVTALTLGWGGEGGFWWGSRPLTGISEMRYALVPHGERWERAGIQQECANWMQPLVPMYGRLSGPPSASLFRVTDPSIEVSAVWRSGDDLFVRLYNSGPEARRFSLVVSGEMEVGGMCLTELDGRWKEDLQPAERPDRSREAALSLARHGLVTIRLQGFRAAQTKS